jgi:hypothetical protein
MMSISSGKKFHFYEKLYTLKAGCRFRVPLINSSPLSSGFMTIGLAPHKNLCGKIELYSF